MENISDNHSFEKKWEYEKRRAQQFLDVAPVLFVGVDLDEKVTLINRMGAFLLGFQERTLIGENWFDRFVADASREPAREAFRNLLTAQKQPSEYSEFMVRNKGGQERLIAGRYALLRDEEGRVSGVLICGEDITEFRLARSLKASHEAQKLEAVGRLAAGVAQDFNNLITGIRGTAEGLKETLRAEDPRQRDLIAILDATDKAFAITRKLRTFGKEQAARPTVLDLNDPVREVSKILHRLIGDEVRVELSLGKPRPIMADPAFVEQVVVNLALNGRDAMPKGGRLTLRTFDDEITREDVKKGHFDLEAGHYAVLEVSDAGQGIDEAALSHLFEPYFSTKGKDRGSGLGLATVYGIMKQAGGEIVVESKAGMGTTFRAFFPVFSQDTASESNPTLPNVSLQGHETVLVIEDEAIVRRVVVNKLRQSGYNVVEAANGREALAEVSKMKEMDLIISDVIMPQMNGPEIVRQIRSTHPHVLVLYMSGYPEEIISSQGVLHAGIHFIEKPYLSSELTRRVRELLDSAKGAGPNN